ncbi:MAG: hypothetical protein Q9191_001193 [Dirinaria sp. TL-2023a]
MSPSSQKKRAILFTRRPASVTSRIIDSLNKRGYDVPLLVCAPGPNGSLSPSSIPSLGTVISGVLDEIDHPPAILCVFNTKLLEQIYIGLDPDLSLVYGFAYPITKKMLSCRAPFVNYHPAPLPRMRGPAPFARMVLDHSIELIASWHYMVAEVDHGPLIHTCDLTVSSCEREKLTGGDVAKAGEDVFFASFDTCLDLVESGFAGTKQDHTDSVGYGGTLLSDEERTIRGDMTKEEVLRLHRALTGTTQKPLLQFDGRLNHVVRVSEVEENGLALGSQKRVGAHIIQSFWGGALKMGIRNV